MNFAAIWTAIRAAWRPVLTAVSSNPKRAAIVLALLSLPVLGAIADRALFRGDSSPEVRVDTVWSERTLIKRDTVTKTVPEQVTVYQRDTVVQYRDTTITIPDPLAGGFRVARPQPLQVGPESVTYTAYDPGPGRWTQQTYAIPEERWDLSATIGASQSIRAIRDRILQPSLAAELALQYRDWTLVGVAGYDTAIGAPFATAGIEWTVWDP